MASPHIVYNGTLINGTEIAYCEERPALDKAHVPPGYQSLAHLHIQFRHGHFIDVPGLTAEGLKNLLDGNPF